MAFLLHRPTVRFTVQPWKPAQAWIPRRQTLLALSPSKPTSNSTSNTNTNSNSSSSNSSSPNAAALLAMAADCMADPENPHLPAKGQGCSLDAAAATQSGSRQ